MYSAKKRAMQDAMEACTQAAKEEPNGTAIASAMKACRKENLKTTLATISVKDSSDVTDTEVNRILDEGVVEKLKKVAKAASDALFTDGEGNETATDALFTKALQESLGTDDEISKTKIEKIIFFLFK